MINYETLKQASKHVRQQTKEKCEVADLIALAVGNDPFYFGTKADHEAAKWFAMIWERFAYTEGVHLRRIHYQVSQQQTPIPMPNGEPYLNSKPCWHFMETSSKCARYLGYVDAEAFTDRRNREHRIFADIREHPAPALYVNSFLSSSDIALPEFPELPTYQLGDGYGFTFGDDGYVGRQPYLLEIWCEKSTMDDVLLPLCQRYQANYVVSLGEQSITSALELVNRARTVKKPVRIFYISDYDPAGTSMPVATSRKIEYYVRKNAPDVDICLSQIALTPEQCETYRLPRSPIAVEKAGFQARKDKFEERHGEGATELDALEALHPGELARVVQEAIRPFFDETLARRVAEEKSRLREAMREAKHEVYARYQDEIDALRADYQRLTQEVAAKMADMQGRFETLWHDMGNELHAFAPDVNDFPIPAAEVSGGDPEAGLYNSKREYLGQLAIYKQFQRKPFNLPTDFPLN